MLTLLFDGWFQCRLSTNPDPADERRGRSGYTFAFAGEPDLDGIIRFHNPVAPRSHGPTVGVFVRKVWDGDHRLDQHPLLGAEIDLAGDPRFREENGALTEAAQEPIHPFHLEIRAGVFSLMRSDDLVAEVANSPQGLHAMPEKKLKSRGSTSAMISRSFACEAAGIADPRAHREDRLRKVRADRDELGSDGSVARLALDERIRQLQVLNPDDRRVMSYGFLEVRTFLLSGALALHGPVALVGGQPSNDPWPIELWMGTWDCDALCGFVRGIVSIPLHPV